MLKRFLEEWLELPWKEALIELIGGFLYFFTLIVYIIFFIGIA